MKTKLCYALLIVVISFIFINKSYAHEITKPHTHQEQQLNTEDKKEVLNPIKFISKNSKQIIDTTYGLIFIYLSIWYASKSFKKQDEEKCLCRIRNNQLTRKG